MDDFLVAYPVYAQFIRGLSTTALSARSLIIKACQAQYWPELSDAGRSTLLEMIIKHPPVLLRVPNHGRILKSLDLIEVIPYYNLDLQDPLESAIILDICRGLPLPDFEVAEARLASWIKEISLSQGTAYTTSKVDWRVIFDPAFHSSSLFEGADPNPNMARKIYHQLVQFRDQFNGRRLYPRCTHKNMSRSTRRSYEDTFDDDLENTSIFGQDDWQRIYHETGHMVEGCCEMRQKWYPAQAKPRTYFAMGGTAYRRCRHLQGFFTDLVNVFAPTNQTTRLQPDRLYIDPDSRHHHVHARVYDMSNFTSGMQEQKFFMEYLASFFQGVIIEIVDEREGLLYQDLGELLLEYNDDCVDGPLLSLERWDAELTEAFPHGLASLLGIFGNLMTCTVAHYLIMSPLVHDDEEINVAGDDGVLPEDEFDTQRIQEAWDVVGSCAREKTFRGDEAGAICLKRPIVENLPHLVTTFNIIPPTVAMATAYLSGKSDSRYSFFDIQDIPVNRRISIVGKDLIRFLRSAYLRKYCDIERLHEVYVGFCKLVKKYQPAIEFMESGLGTFGTEYFWPISPKLYEFDALSPRHCLVLYHSPHSMNVRHLERVSVESTSLCVVGDTATGNLTPRLSMLKRFGYLDVIEVMDDLVGYTEIMRYWNILLSPSVYVPVVYEFCVLRDIPAAFLEWV
jgi:hypothetical protein